MNKEIHNKIEKALNPYRDWSQEAIAECHDPIVIKGDNFEYNLTVANLPGILKRFPKGDTIRPTGTGSCRPDRSRSLQKLYAKCQQLEKKEIQAWRRRVVKEVSSYGMTIEPYPMLTSKDMVSMMDQFLRHHVVRRKKIQIVMYSEKSIALFGDTKEHKEQLKKLGCKFNPFLVRDGKKTPGWIASKKRINEVESYIKRKHVAI